MVKNTMADLPVKAWSFITFLLKQRSLICTQRIENYGRCCLIVALEDRFRYACEEKKITLLPYIYEIFEKAPVKKGVFSSLRSLGR